MGRHVVSQVIKLMLQKQIHVKGSRILVMGLTFKENCPDLRNTRVVDIVSEFQEYGAEVDVYDPWASAIETRHEYGLDLVETLEPHTYAAIIVAVGHDQFKQMSSEEFRKLGQPNSVLFDIKYILPAGDVDGRL